MCNPTTAGVTYSKRSRAGLVSNQKSEMFCKATRRVPLVKSTVIGRSTSWVLQLIEFPDWA